MSEKKVSREIKRNFIQLMAAAVLNGYAIGFKYSGQTGKEVRLA